MEGGSGSRSGKQEGGGKPFKKKPYSGGRHQPGPTPPDVLEKFPGLKVVKRKNFVQGGGVMRKRWEDKRSIYEWDSRHNTLERYSKATKEHLGEYSLETGKRLKWPDKTRRLRD